MTCKFDYVEIRVNEYLLEELQDAETRVKELELILEQRNNKLHEMNEKYLYEKRINESLRAELNALCGSGERKSE